MLNQIEKQVDVLNVFCSTGEEILFWEIVLFSIYFVSSQIRFEINNFVMRYNAKYLLDANNKLIIEKIGWNKIKEFHKELEPFGICKVR